VVDSLTINLVGQVIEFIDSTVVQALSLGNQ